MINSEEPPNKKIKISKPTLFKDLNISFEEDVSKYLKEQYGEEHFENIRKVLWYEFVSFKIQLVHLLP
jgi:hypothetical protein